MTGIGRVVQLAMESAIFSRDSSSKKVQKLPLSSSLLSYLLCIFFNATEQRPK
jgi:hypothetical protein